MKVSPERQKVLSMKVTPEVRRLVEQLAARLTVKTGRRHTLTDVMEMAVKGLAKREGVSL